MLASWVSQASFNPPSITVAVAKDRAVESFMLPGGNFNLNILKLGNEKETMKALLKGFAPGEDRFGDMKVSYSENNECAIVTDALAYCECAVKSRMECGDHWVVLAEVTGGRVLRRGRGNRPCTTEKQGRAINYHTRARREKEREKEKERESTTNARRTEFNQTRTITSTRAGSSKT